MIKIEYKRWLTATQINTFAGNWGCPRKWYLQYKLKKKQRPSIHIVRGNIVHKTLEFFFKKLLHRKPDPTTATLAEFDRLWADSIYQLKALPLKPPFDLDHYYHDSRQMILNWLDSFRSEDPKDLNPTTEETIWNHPQKLWCKVDRRFNANGWINTVDYKTSKSNEMTNDTRLQLVIQYLCVAENNKGKKVKVGAHFLKFPGQPEIWEPTVEDIKWTLDKIRYFRENTRSENEEDYPCTCGGWCKRNFQDA